MFKILTKEQLADNVFKMRLEAPLIAEERSPGQFVILSVNEDFGERIPLTIADANAAEGWIMIIFQVVGHTTTLLARMEPGDSIPTVVGPLGMPTHIEKIGTAVCVGGGIGVAPLHPIAQALKNIGNKVITVLGARSRELVILEDEMNAVSDELIVCTDDGSYGRKALVTEPLEELCRRDPHPDIVVAIGPPIMMKFCAETTRPYGVHTVVSLNTIMVDGTGMCGGCRITVGNKTKFVCVDGPEFDGHLVDFDELINRLGSYKNHESKAKTRLEDTCECRLDAQARKIEKDREDGHEPSFTRRTERGSGSSA